MSRKNLLLNSARASRTLSQTKGGTSAILLPSASSERTMSDFCKPKGGGGSPQKSLTMENLNPNIIALQYAVRGPLVIRSVEIAKELKEGKSKPFKTVINANIGDAHAMGQRPITFIRQVLACCIDPSLIETADYPSDVKERACELLGDVRNGEVIKTGPTGYNLYVWWCGRAGDEVSCYSGASMGSYTGSYGVDLIRRSVADFIQRRDGQPADPENIVLCAGASTGIKSVLQLFCNTVDGKKSGVMIPIPQYPLYSAALAEYGLGAVDYYLDEERGWGLGADELERAYEQGSKQLAVRALVIINPGNPTGQVLTRENIETIIKFAHAKKLFILADEVYQDNVYAKGSKFYSFKKVMTEMGPPYSGLELASFMSVSKGYMGECGLRGGWMELSNMEPGVMTNLLKALSAMLCPSTLGQVAVECVARPPLPGQPSYELYRQERDGVLASLHERADMISATFNSMPGYKCNVVQGAMYAFPSIQIPPKAIEAAAAKGQQPDVFYAFSLLEETGICIVPGSGFGQKPGTWHFRTTILPQVPLLKEMLNIFKTFHDKFTQKYA